MELADHTINIVHVCDYIRMPGSEMNLLKHFPMQSPSGIFNCSCSAEILVNDPASDVFRLLGERNHDLCNCCLWTGRLQSWSTIQTHNRWRWRQTASLTSLCAAFIRDRFRSTADGSSTSLCATFACYSATRRRSWTDSSPTAQSAGWRREEGSYNTSLIRSNAACVTSGAELSSLYIMAPWSFLSPSGDDEQTEVDWVVNIVENGRLCHGGVVWKGAILSRRTTVICWVFGRMGGAVA